MHLQTLASGQAPARHGRQPCSPAHQGPPSHRRPHMPSAHRTCPGAGEIARVALKRGLIKCTGKTPEATMASALYTDIKRKVGGRVRLWSDWQAGVVLGGRPIRLAPPTDIRVVGTQLLMTPSTRQQGSDERDCGARGRRGGTTSCCSCCCPRPAPCPPSKPAGGFVHLHSPARGSFWLARVD